MYLQTSRLCYTLRFSDFLSQKAISFNKNFYNQARRQDLQVDYSIGEGWFSMGERKMVLRFSAKDINQILVKKLLTF